MPIVYALLALGGLGCLFGLVLTFADKKFYVPVDEKVARIRENVAGANCGACGFPGCDGFAEAVAAGKAPINGCTPGGAKTLNALAEIMGVTAEAGTPRVARVLCQGAAGIAKVRYESDVATCALANKLAGGPKMCQYACMGLGDCFRACKFGAIKMENSIAVIDEEKCTACGMCVAACPRSVIEMLPKTATVTVRCQSQAPAKETRDACQKGCIACKRCEKTCRFDAIHVNNGYAKIDTDKCTQCEECVAVCPVKCITVVGKEVVVEQAAEAQVS